MASLLMLVGCAKKEVAVEVTCPKMLSEYRVRQRGCSLTHSARTPPARHRNSFLGRGFFGGRGVFGGQEIFWGQGSFWIFFGLGNLFWDGRFFWGREIFLGRGILFLGWGDFLLSSPVP